MISNKKDIVASIIKKNGVDLNEEEIHYVREISEDNYLKKQFEEFILLECLLDSNLDQFDEEKAWGKFQHKIVFKSKIKRFKDYLPIAASIIFFLSLGTSLIFFENKKNNTELNKDTTIVKIRNKIIELNKTNHSQKGIINISEDSKLLITNSNETKFMSNNLLSKEEIFISVPRGKKHTLILPDGSKITLNADSQLTFFSNYKNERTVKLSGEAFFEVEKDHDHPFVVETNRLKTSVLGTKFNISAYANDFSSEVVLVEGKVRVFNKANTDSSGKLLLPNSKASLDSNGKLKIDITNTKIATAWLRNTLIFNDMKLANIAKKLERTYNKTISVPPNISKNKFTGHFKNESLINILEIFRTTNHFEYKLNKNHVILFKKNAP